MRTFPCKNFALPARPLAFFDAGPEQAEASRLVQDSYFELDDLLAVRDQMMGAAR